MSLLLRSNQVRILSAIRSALDTLGMLDQLAIVGGLARHLGGDPKLPGDIDVFIERSLCVQYWDFFELLIPHGIVSVRDVLDKPKFLWKPCLPDIAHARALTIDAAATLRGEKSGALDICFRADNLDHIPNAERWVDTLDTCSSGASTDKAIHAGHQRLKAELAGKECDLLAPVMSSQCALYYRLRN